MKVKWMLLWTAILAASPLLARENTDVVVMKNGDRITCEIKALRSNTLYISVSYILGTISVDWLKVTRIESRQLFIVKTRNGTVYTGAISTAKASGGRPGEIQILKAPQSEVTLRREEIAEVDETARGFWQRLNGQIGLGFTYSKGNESAQYNLNSDVEYPRERWSAGAGYTSNYSSNSGSSPSKRNEGTLVAQRLLRWNNWYYTGLADFLQSSVQGIHLQSLFGGGIGRQIKNTGGTFFTVYGGLAWQKIGYAQTLLGTPTQKVTSGLFGANLKLYRFDRTTLTADANFFPALSQPGRIRYNLKSSYYVKLWGKFNWNFTVYDTWDNQPPPGFVGSDYGATSGINLTFGNR